MRETVFDRALRIHGLSQEQCDEARRLLGLSGLAPNDVDSVALVVLVRLDMVNSQIGENIGDIQTVVRDLLTDSKAEIHEMIADTQRLTDDIVKSAADRLAEQKASAVRLATSDIAKRLESTAKRIFNTHARALNLRLGAWVAVAALVLVAASGMTAAHFVRTADDMRLVSVGKLTAPLADVERLVELQAWNGSLASIVAERCAPGSWRRFTVAARAACDVPIWLEPAPAPARAREDDSHSVDSTLRTVDPVLLLGVGGVVGFLVGVLLTGRRRVTGER